MKKNLIKFIIVIVFLFVSTQIVFAISNSFLKDAFFGGKITNTKATEIEEKENGGYSCDLNGGTSITINSIKGPTTYIIPSTTTSKTGRGVGSGKWIIGKYDGQTMITCKKSCGDAECMDYVNLNKISLFGTS